MVQSIESVIVQPDISRIIEGLRDAGYDLNSALADIVDNSVAANASEISVNLEIDYSGLLSIAIGDNGIGMDEDDLINAMRYGSQERSNKASLGKFGLGLKTASTAFCRRLVVITRNAGDAPVLVAVWDLDDISRSREWRLMRPIPSEEHKEMLDAIAPAGSGTVVKWEKIDRIFSDYKDPRGKPRRTAVANAAKSLTTHLAMVFQRFLDHDDERAPNISLWVNSEKVHAWDPFAVSITKDPVMETNQKVETQEGAQTSFSIRVFILPRKDEYESIEEMKEANISNELQGIYVYRENRLIHGPDWLGLFRSEPHSSLLRVELSFDHSLDAAFHVDIKKSRILPAPELQDWLRNKFLAGPRREAEERYRKGAASKSAQADANLHATSDKVIDRRKDSLATATITNVDKATENVTLRNNFGESTARFRIVESDSSKPVYIDVADNLEYGVLWVTSIINGSNGVTLNTKHPYYRKVYLPNTDNSTIVQALDYLLWSLAQAELNNSNPGNQEALVDFRIDVSKNLKRLVADLPEPKDD